MTAGPYPLLDRVRAATADEYIIEGELGRGGMAAVFLGRDVALNRRVAIKVMLPDLVGVAGSLDRFVVEARTAAQLDHPGIVTVYAVKQRDGLTFIVMKYVEGWTLDQVIATRGALESGVVATIGSQVAEALHFAHSQGVVHRDVKPSNIIIDPHGRPIVTDFGIAKVTASPSLTIAGMTVGTPGYMSPEQCRGIAVTAASDQYSLGVVLYELLTGRAPFSGTLFELLQAHTSAAPPPIREVKPEVDAALEAIIMIMLAKNETERFPSLHDVSRALVSLVPRRSQEADRHAIMAAVTPEEIAPAAPVAGGASPRPSRDRRVVAVVVAAALLAAVAYAIASRTAGTKTVAPTKPTDSIPAATPETSLTARVDTAPSTKRDTTAKLPPVDASKASTLSTKTPTPRTTPKRDSVGQARPDSNAARCAALNLKFSLGDELTRADTIFLRRECAKYRPRAPGV